MGTSNPQNQLRRGRHDGRQDGNQFNNAGWFLFGQIALKVGKQPLTEYP
jgi:hypothetical protein